MGKVVLLIAIVGVLFVPGYFFSCYDGLSALYDSTNGPNWRNKHNWKTGSSPTGCCDWHGVTCNSKNVVTQVILSGNNLDGTIPDIFFDACVNMTTMDLSYNRVRGSIPNSNGFVSMVEIDLNNNQLEGTIPESFATLSKLYALDLSVNKLTGTIPKQFSNYKGFELFFVSNNSLSGSLYEGFTSNIKHLDGQYDHFSGPFPQSWCNVPQFNFVGSTFECPLPSCCGYCYGNTCQICGDCK